MRGRLKTLIFILSLALNVPFVALWATHSFGRHGPPHRPGGPPGPGGGPRGFYLRAGLSEAQLKEIGPRLDAFEKASRENFREIRRLRQELMALVAGEALDLDAIHAKQLEINKCEERSQDLMLENILADRKTLSPEQWKKLHELMREGFHRPERGHPPGAPGGGRPSESGPPKGEGR